MKTDSKIIVKARNIFKDFGDDDIITPVLHDINLDIYYGKLTMIVGPSGCVKTTLISILTGILSHSSGEVFIDDINLTALPDHEKILLRRKKMGFIFQQYNLLSSLTSSENAAIPLIASGMKMDLAIKESNKILESIGMAAHLNKLPNQLSGGQQQRVAIARALVHKPKLIVCDEPTAALDADTGHKIMEILKSMAVNDGVAIIVVTHDSRIFDFADQIIYLEDGKIVNKNNN